MLAILNFLNAHNLPIFQPILMILISKFIVHRALSDKTYLSLGLLSASRNKKYNFQLHTLILSLLRHDHKVPKQYKFIKLSSSSCPKNTEYIYFLIQLTIIKQGLFQTFWGKAPGLNWEKYVAFWEFFGSVK